MKNCINHPNKKAFSVCHNCGKEYCQQCLDEGKEFYYCKNPECQESLRKELVPESLPLHLICPNCESELELSQDERISGKIHCRECEALIDFTGNPPKIIEKKDYKEIINSLNQGDIALIKSVLEDGEIDYFVLGENFLSVRPLLEPARIFVNVNQLNETHKLLKDFKLNIFGLSIRQDEQ
jgi:hypothetical protein